MGKKYLLLRNNKQSGPFTLEELAGNGFKKYDLVWVEGESAGWRSPDEIPQIQFSLSPAPEQNLPVATQSVQHPAAALNRHVFVSLPRAERKWVNPVPVTFNNPNINSISPVEEELTPEQKLEQKAALLRQRAMNYKAEAVTAEGELKTKFSRSLDDIKEEYSNWMRGQSNSDRTSTLNRATVKNDSSAWIQRGAIALGLMAMAGIGYMLLLDAPPAAIVASAHSPVKQNQSVAKDVLSRSQAASSAVHEKATAAKQIQKKIKKEPAAFIPVPKSSVKPVVSMHHSAAKKETATPPALGKSAKTTVANRVTTSGYSTNAGSGEWMVVLNNNSAESLKMVAVNVEYTKEGRKAVTKTIYFNDIAPNSTASTAVQLPGKAEAVTYKIGLISSEGGSLYFARN